MKTRSFVSFLLTMLLACASSSPVASQPSTVPGVPKISNLEIPTTIKASEAFPVSFDYEDEDADITTVIVTFDWGQGQETHKFPATRIKGKSGRSDGQLRTGPRTGPIKIHIYVEDAKGNKSNTLTKETQRI